MERARTVFRDFLVNRFGFSKEFASLISEELISYMKREILTKGKFSLPGIGAFVLKPSPRSKTGVRLGFNTSLLMKKALSADE